MDDERWKEINRIYRKSLKVLRDNQTFEDMTFSQHPRSIEARGEVAALVPELLQEIKHLRKLVKPPAS